MFEVELKMLETLTEGIKGKIYSEGGGSDPVKSRLEDMVENGMVNIKIACSLSALAGELEQAAAVQKQKRKRGPKKPKPTPEDIMAAHDKEKGEPGGSGVELPGV